MRLKLFKECPHFAASIYSGNQEVPFKDSIWIEALALRELARGSIRVQGQLCAILVDLRYCDKGGRPEIGGSRVVVESVPIRDVAKFWKGSPKVVESWITEAYNEDTLDAADKDGKPPSPPTFILASLGRDDTKPYIQLLPRATSFNSNTVCFQTTLVTPESLSKNGEMHLD